MSDDTMTSGNAPSQPHASLPGRLIAFLYGIVAYLAFFMTLLHFVGFVGNLVVPKSVDSGTAGPAGIALAANLGLIALFGIQHSVMARAAFKHWWTKLVPRPVERSTYVLFSALILALVMWLWQPMPAQVWLVDNTLAASALWALFALGWVILLLSSFMTNHFDLFGLRQVTLYLLGKPYTPVKFRARWLYRYMRHPLYSGFLLSFWATPDMTVGHLVLAAGFSTYIVIGTLFEERDLLHNFGESYRNYARNLPRYVPRLTRWKQ